VTDLTPSFPSTHPLATTLLADTILMRLCTAHTFLCIKSVMGPEAFFGFLNPEDGTGRFFRNVGKKFHYLLCNNPEERSSQVY